MEKISGNYFDGQSSAMYAAQISFSENYIKIEYENRDSNSVESIWQLENIKKDDIGLRTFLRLIYQGESREVLEISDLNAIVFFQNSYSQKSFAKEHIDVKLGKNKLALIAFFIIVVAFLTSLYFWGLPWASDTIARLIPTTIEDQYGEGIRNTYIETVNIDSAATETLNLFFDELGYESENTLQLYVVKSDVVNAFAFPGKTIVVFDEIIRRIQSKEQLAALLAHEYAHVQNRHALRTMVEGFSSGLLLSIVIGDASGAIGGIAQSADQLRLLKYSRDFEIESDNKGLEMMEKQQIDLVGMEELFSILKKEEEAIFGDSDILKKLDFLSTHPLTDDRIKNAIQVAKSSSVKTLTHQNLETIFQILKRETTPVCFLDD